MGNDASPRIMNEIAALLAEDTVYPLDGTLLYADVADNAVRAAIFKLREEDILYRDWPRGELADLLLELWRLERPDQRWDELELLIRDGRFKASFTYAEEIDRNEDEFHRRDRIVWRHFGQLPIVYPPWPPSDDEGQAWDL